MLSWEVEGQAPRTQLDMLGWYPFLSHLLEVVPLAFYGD